MTDHEAAILTNIRQQLDGLLAAYHTTRPAGNGTGRADLHTFANLVGATAYLQECERYEPGVWEIIETDNRYAVQRRQ